jgi:Telomeric repeat-binding factor 2.
MKKKLCVLTMMMAAMLTGCTDVPDLSNVDNSLAAQYVADALLRNDKNYDDSLDYDHSILQATPTPAPTPVPTPAPSGGPDKDDGSSVPNGDGGSKPGDNLESVSVSDIYGISGINIKAGTYRVTSSYGSSVAVCTPKKGNKLVVVNFTVANTSKASKKVNLQKQKIQAELLSGTTRLGAPMLSIVEGDLQYFNTMLNGGRKKQGVLVFEVDKSTKLKDVKVRFVKNGKEAVVSVR